MSITATKKILKTNRIGILLGSFNPIHNGHLVMATSAIRDGLVDEVLFVPSVQNPWKEDYSVSFWHRCTMIRRALSGLNNCNITEIEALGTSPYYTCNTLKMLKQQYPNDELILLVGSDVKNQIINWKNGDWILNNFKIITVDRPGYKSQNPEIEAVSSISSTEVRDRIKRNQSIEELVPRRVASYIYQQNLYK